MMDENHGFWQNLQVWQKRCQNGGFHILQKSLKIAQNSLEIELKIGGFGSSRGARFGRPGGPGPAAASSSPLLPELVPREIRVLEGLGKTGVFGENGGFRALVYRGIWGYPQNHQKPGFGRIPWGGLGGRGARGVPNWRIIKYRPGVHTPGRGPRTLSQDPGPTTLTGYRGNRGFPGFSGFGVIPGFQEIPQCTLEWSLDRTVERQLSHRK